jgi:DNA-binding transcriptional LysR family regulator
MFLALHRARTLAGAGERLDVDASTASRRLVALEETLGVRLFDRTRDGLLPTHAAEQVLPFAEEIEAGILRFASTADTLESAVEGVVRVAVPPGIAEAFVAPSLGRLLKRHPKLRVELDARITIVDLSRREADLAIRTIEPTSGDLVRQRMLAGRPAILASSAYAKELSPLRDVREARWITWGTDLDHIPATRFVMAHGIEPVLRTSSIGAQVAAAEDGLGVVLLTADYARVRRLVPVKLAGALGETFARLPDEHVWLVCHSAMRRVPRVAAVWDFVLEEMGRFTAARR